MSFENPGDDEVRALLSRVKRIAVVGLSPKAHRDSYRVSAYMQRHGYEIVPVYPREDEILGARVHRSLAEVPGPVDLVNVFRRADEVGAVVDEFLATDFPAIWTQYDCVDEAAALRAAERGRFVVMDRCLMVEHNRLLR